MSKVRQVRIHTDCMKSDKEKNEKKRKGQSRRGWHLRRKEMVERAEVDFCFVLRHTHFLSPDPLCILLFYI